MMCAKRFIHSYEQSPRPFLTLALGPAGAGKTTWAQNRFLEGSERAFLVVSSPRQAETYSEQLAQRVGKPAAEITPFVLPFRALIAEINKGALKPGERIIGRTLQRLAVADILHTHLRPDDFFGRMMEAPGFVTALTERIREWKLACLTPEDLERGGSDAADQMNDPAFARKTQEMARLYAAYETFLRRNHLRDEEDGFPLAVQRISDALVPLPGNASLIIVDGFYRFTRSQRQVLSALAGRPLRGGTPEVDVAVTLPHDSARPLLFMASERTRQTFQAEFTVREVTFPAREGDRPASLAALSTRLFRTEAAPRIKERAREREEQANQGNPTRTQTPDPLDTGQPASGKRHKEMPVQIFDAPNPYVEAEMVARAFRRLRETDRYRWSDFAIILRTLGDYAPILSAVFERYGIPLGVDGPERLAENPLLKTVLQLMAIVRRGWQRDDVLAFLKSSYTAPTKLQADALRKRAQAYGLREGREAWLKMAEEAEIEPSVTDALREIARFDALLTEGRAQPIAFAGWIRAILLDFRLEQRIALGEPVRADRDRAALESALEVMDALAHMEVLAGRAAISFPAFHDALLAAWQEASAIAPTGTDVVRVLEPFDTRERPIKVAAVMGLTERVFPRRAMEDPFLRDAERAALREVAGIDLEAQQARSDDERLFFYLAVTAPTEQLILSFPRAANESDTLPSFYVDEVRTALASDKETGKTGRQGEDKPVSPFLITISRTLADVAPQPEEAVSDGDRLLAACAELFDPGMQGDPERRTIRRRQATGLMRACLEDEKQARKTQNVVASRFLPRLPCLRDPSIRNAFIHAKTVYSISELEAYNRCPFQYLFRHVLKLRPEADGANARDQSTILHAVLRRYFRRKAAGEKEKREGKREKEVKKGEEETTERMQQDLRALLHETLAQERLDATPHRVRMTQRLLADALDAFAARETRFTPQFGVTPAYFELTFGMGMNGRTTLDEEDREDWGTADIGALGEEVSIYDAHSRPDPLLLYPAEGGDPVPVCGVIDRVDLDHTGQRALLLDYKLGRPPDFSELQRGVSLQMPLALLAIEQLWGKAGAVGCYDSMRESGRRRFHRAEHVKIQHFAPLLPLDDATTVKPLNREQYAELTRTAQANAIRAVRGLETGRIDATPGEYCRACAYADVCRTTLAEGHDGEAFPPASETPF